MATTVNVNIKATNKVTRPVRKAGREIKQLGKTAKQAGKDAKSDWGGVGDLFSGLLPRGLQSTIRGFKSTQRQIGRLSKGFKVLKGAIAATGLGLLVVALGEIVANWDSISEAITGATDETEKQVALAKENVDASQEQLDTISATENILKLQGKTEEDILNMRMAATDEAIATQKILVQSLIDQRNEQQAAAQQAKDITQALIRLFTAPLTIALGTIDKISEGLVAIGVLTEATNLEESFSGGLAGLLFDPEAIGEEGDKAIDKAEEQLTKLENQRAGYLVRRRDEENREQEQNKKERDAQADREAKQAEANEQYLAEQIRKIRRQAELDAIEDEETRAVRKREQALEDAQAQFLARGATDAQLLELEEQYERDVDAIRAKYKDQRDKQAEEDRKEAERKSKEDKDKARQDIMDRLNMEQEVTEQGLSILSNINSAFSKKQDKESKKQFQRNQALAVAETLVSTYFSAQKAYQSQLTATPDSPIRAALAAAAAVASGLARVAAIKAQKYNAGGSGGGGGGGGGRSGFSGPQQPGGPPIPQRLVSPDQMRAYVVQTDLQGQSEAASKMQAQTVL